MEIEYTLTEDDVIAAQSYQARHGPDAAPWSSMWKWQAVFIAVLTLILLAYALRDPRAPDWGFVVMVVLPLVAAAVLAFLFKGMFSGKLADWLVRRALREGRDADKLFSKQRLRITPEGLTHMSDYSAETTLWKAVDGIIVTPEYALFYPTKMTVYILPKRAFTSEQDFLNFAETAQRYHQEAVQA